MNKIKQVTKPINIEPAKQKIGTFCASRERSPHEVLQKLLSWGIDRSNAEDILSLLLKEGFVDEQRFANAYCRDKFEFNSWGKQKIRLSIGRHNISSRCVEQALSGIDEHTYFERICRLSKKKFSSIKETNPDKRKQKALAYLKGKGFEQDLIGKAIEELVNETSH